MVNPNCSIPECDSGMAHQGRGWCRHHYMRWYFYGDPCREPHRRPTVCRFPLCEEPVGRHSGKGYCKFHYRRLLYYGTPFGPAPVQLSMGKECSKCGVWKWLAEFSYDQRRTGGRQAACLDCAAKWKDKNPERVREYKRDKRAGVGRRLILAAQPREPISISVVGERDGWVCGFCSR